MALAVRVAWAPASGSRARLPPAPWPQAATVLAGRADVVKELVAHAWPEGRKVRVLREVREGGVAPDAWEFKDGHAIVPAPGDEDAAILVTHGALHVIDQMEQTQRSGAMCLELVRDTAGLKVGGCDCLVFGFYKVCRFRLVAFCIVCLGEHRSQWS